MEINRLSIPQKQRWGKKDADWDLSPEAAVRQGSSLWRPGFRHRGISPLTPLHSSIRPGSFRAIWSTPCLRMDPSTHTRVYRTIPLANYHYGIIAVLMNSFHFPVNTSRWRSYSRLITHEPQLRFHRFFYVSFTLYLITNPQVFLFAINRLGSGWLTSHLTTLQSISGRFNAPKRRNDNSYRYSD